MSIRVGNKHRWNQSNAIVFIYRKQEMSEHISKQMIEGYIERVLDAPDLLAADEHLAECDECCKKLEVAGKLDRGRFVGLFEPVEQMYLHPTFEQLEQYADDFTDEAETEFVEFHIEDCLECGHELDALLEMRRLVESDLASRAVIESPDEMGNTWIRKWFTVRGFPRIALGAAAIAVLATIGFLVLRTSGPSDSTLTSVEPQATPSPTVQPTAVIIAEVSSTPQPDATVEIVPDPNAPASDLSSLPASSRTDVERAISSGRLSIPNELRQMSARSGTLMGGGSDEVPFALSYPVGKVVKTARPLFSWKPLQDADSYTVEIYDSEFNRVVSSPVINGAQWQPRKPLPRNRTLVWQVTATKDGDSIKSPIRPAPDARFRILGSNQSARLQRSADAIKGQHLALGILYAEAGLFDEAEKEFQSELKKNPGSRVAQKFLREVRAAKTGQ